MSTQKTRTESPAAAEAAGDTTAAVEWRGITFEVPRYRADWPFPAVEAAEEAKWAVFVREMLPSRALAQLRAMSPTQRDVYDLLDTMADALGFDRRGE